MKRQALNLVPFINHDIFYYIALHLGPLDLIMCSMVCKRWLHWVDGSACANRWKSFFETAMENGLFGGPLRFNQFTRVDFAQNSIVHLPDDPTPQWFFDQLSLLQQRAIVATHMFVKDCQPIIAPAWDEETRLMFTVRPRGHIRIFIDLVRGRIAQLEYEWVLPTPSEEHPRPMELLIGGYRAWLQTGTHPSSCSPTDYYS